MTSFPYTLHETLLKIEDVSLAFGKVIKNAQGEITNAEKLVLHRVNAEIKNIVRPGMSQGQVVGFLGPSGIGKTQLFKIIAGLKKPTTGRVLINADATPVRAGMVGVVPQHYPLFLHRNVLTNLLIAGKATGMARANAVEKAMGLLERFGLADKANAWPEELSGGQRQRACICQQMMCSSHFLLMDEPFSGLDVGMLTQVINLVKEVSTADELNTIIVVTHDTTAAMLVSDHLWLMGRDRDANGQVIPGAYIKDEINLINEGFAWRDDLADDPRFLKFVSDMKKRMMFEL